MEDAIAFVEPRKRPHIHPFTWGPVRTVHEIGRYTVVEYVYTCQNDSGGRRKGDTEIQFACYVDDRDLHESACSLEEAILVCIANRNGGAHDEAAYYAAKLLDLHFEGEGR